MIKVEGQYISTKERITFKASLSWYCHLIPKISLRWGWSTDIFISDHDNFLADEINWFVTKKAFIFCYQQFLPPHCKTSMNTFGSVWTWIFLWHLLSCSLTPFTTIQNELINYAAWNLMGTICLQWAPNVLNSSCIFCFFAVWHHSAIHILFRIILSTTKNSIVNWRQTSAA